MLKSVSQMCRRVALKCVFQLCMNGIVEECVTDVWEGSAEVCVPVV